MSAFTVTCHFEVVCERVPLAVLILVLGTTGWFGVSRLVRGEVLRVREEVKEVQKCLDHPWNCTLGNGRPVVFAEYA